MARPEKNTVDYFPFDCRVGKANRYLDKKYGNDGYATWVRILRELASTPFHYLDLSNEINLLDLAALCNLDEVKLTQIIEDLCRFGEFEADVWHEFKVIFNPKFMVGIMDAYKKRTNKPLTLSELKERLLYLRGISATETPLKGGDKSQRKEKKRIVNESNNNIGEFSEKIETGEIEFLTPSEEVEKLNIMQDAQIWHEQSEMQLKCPQGLFKQKIPAFFDEIRSTGDLRKTIAELQKFYFYWFRKKLKDGTIDQNGSNASLSDVAKGAVNILTKSKAC